MENDGKAENLLLSPMTIEEARNVMWIRPNREPIGKLLDKGYLTSDRLRWAAENAYSAQLRQAAALILDDLARNQESQLIKKSEPIMETQTSSPLPPVNIPISIEEAEKTIWPFSVFKGQQIGSLVKAKQLTLKDLLYAVQNAWEIRVKQAATILMLRQLNQALNEPIPSAGNLRIFSGGRSFSEWKQFQITLIQGIILGIGITGWLVFWFVLLGPKIKVFLPKLTASVLKTIFEGLSISSMEVSVLKAIVVITEILIVTIIAAMTFWIFTFSMNTILKSLARKLDIYRKGQDGENRISEIMLLTLDGNWSLFRNVILPGKKGDLDLILVGPPGVWTLEVKNFYGEYRNNTEHWEYRIGNSWKVMKKNPTGQARQNARQLFNILKPYGIKRIDPIIVWANPESLVTTTNPAVPVWKYAQLSEELGNIWQNQLISKSDQERIENKLSELCKK